MKVRDFAEKLNMRIVSGDGSLDRIITGVYTGDLLSWVMSHAEKGDAWITILTNLNTVAVAMLTEVSCIIIPEGVTVEEATVNKAKQEGIVILSSDMKTYEICWRAHELLSEVV